jgi:oxygen-independent coproporphyrinogen-3 oxidase
MFRKKTQDQCSKNNISYCCQEDGMVGLGSGARSYTEEIHYSTEYAVGRRGVVDIINSYVHETDDDFSLARYGIRLSEDEQKRRYCIKSLLHNEGLNPRRYKNRFSSDVFFDFPELNSLVSAGMAFFASAGELSLTASGMELSDSIGPWMYSKDIERLMANYDLR